MSYVAWIRRLVGHSKIILAYSTVILRDDRGRVLLQRRADLPVWGFPGGVLEYGEDIQTCARRELQEETGLEVGDLRLVGLYTSPRYDVAYPNGDLAQQFTICLTGLVSGGRMAVDGDEALEQRFFAPAAAPRADMTPWYRQMLDDLDAAVPADDPPESAPADAPDMLSLLPDAPGLIVPCVVLLGVCPDGRLMARQSELGSHLPVAGMRVGETAAAAAARLPLQMTGVAHAAPRFVGVLSDPALTTGLLGGPGCHPVAAVFHVDVDEQLRTPGTVAWVLPQALVATDARVAAALQPILSGGSDALILR